MSFSVEIKGLRELEEQIKNLPSRLTKEVDSVIENGAKVFAARAKRDAPKDFGQLAGAIGYAKLAPMNFEVFANKKYAPYPEFGTIKYVFYGEAWVDEPLMAYAAQFKGKGLRKDGSMYPRPYFFKQASLVKKMIEDGLAAIMKAEKL